MIRIPKILFFTSLISIEISSCELNTSPAIQGHWHSIENNQNGIYHTLDIDDTVSIVDQFTLSGIKSPPINLWDGKNIVLPTVFSYYSKDFQLLGDTLIIEKEFKYKKMTDCQTKKDLFSNLFIEIDLPEGDEGLNFGKLKENFHPAFISVGKLKKGIGYKNASGDFVNSDDFFIQIDDVLPSLEYIPAFIITENRAVEGPGRLAVILNLDYKVPDEFYQDLVNTINNTAVSSTVFRTFWDQENNMPVFKKIDDISL